MGYGDGIPAQVSAWARGNNGQGQELGPCAGQMAGLSSSNAWPTRTAARSRPELVVTAAQVLDQGVATDDHARRSMHLEPRPEPCLQATVVALEPVLVPGGAMQRGRNQFLDHVGQRRSPVGDHLDRVAVNSQAAVKNLRAEAMSPRCETYTPITRPCWSTAR